MDAMGGICEALACCIIPRLSSPSGSCFFLDRRGFHEDDFMHTCVAYLSSCKQSVGDEVD